MFLPEFNIDLAFNLVRPDDSKQLLQKQVVQSNRKLLLFSGLGTPSSLAVEFNQCHLFGIRLNMIAANLLSLDTMQGLEKLVGGRQCDFSRQIQLHRGFDTKYFRFSNKSTLVELFILSSITDEPDLSLAMKIGICPR
ncbi:MAG: hypothetical protein R2792_15820 [Saprospiraceae bacterium]